MVRLNSRSDRRTLQEMKGFIDGIDKLQTTVQPSEFQQIDTAKTF